MFGCFSAFFSFLLSLRLYICYCYCYFYFCHKRWLKMVENYVKSQRANCTYHLYTISSNVRKALDRLITCKNWWYHVFSHSWMLRWQKIPLLFNLFCCVFYLLRTTLTQKVWDEHQETTTTTKKTITLIEWIPASDFMSFTFHTITSYTLFMRSVSRNCN